MELARLEGLEPPAHGLEGRCSIQLSYRRMPQDGFRSYRRFQWKPAVSADRYVLYHCDFAVSTDFSPLHIDKTTAEVYAIRVRGEQTVAGLRE